ncbi:MAG: glycosyltransferase family 4 protein, partial [Candidatus Pacearchaeota archaeon]|nr:glycosyltransferase family 4 protein [Candidatus Pacearchaeota archaeon]
MRMCQAFSDSGHEVMLSGRASEQKMIDPIRYYELKGGFKVKTVFLGKILNNSFIVRKTLLDGIVLAFFNRLLIKEFKPEIIYSRLTLFELLLVPRHLPIVFEMHSLGHLNHWYRKKIFKFIIKIKNFKRFIVTSKMTKKYLSTILP